MNKAVAIGSQLLRWFWVRTNTQCRKRWAECLDPFLNTDRLTAKGDAKLTAAVMEIGNDCVQANSVRDFLREVQVV
jgi:hypothetical protein